MFVHEEWGDEIWESFLVHGLANWSHDFHVGGLAGDSSLAPGSKDWHREVDVVLLRALSNRHGDDARRFLNDLNDGSIPER